MIPTDDVMNVMKDLTDEVELHHNWQTISLNVTL